MDYFSYLITSKLLFLCVIKDIKIILASKGTPHFCTMKLQYILSYELQDNVSSVEVKVKVKVKVKVNVRVKVLEHTTTA